MTDNDKEEYAFSESDAGQVLNFGANTTDDKGTNLFPEIGTKIVAQVLDWEMGFADTKTGKTKPILQLKTNDGALYQRVLGSDMRKKIYSLGIKKPSDLIGQFITFEKYDTKSSRPTMRWGLQIIAISKERP